jgi:copper(I)-binding protein
MISNLPPVSASRRKPGLAASTLLLVATLAIGTLAAATPGTAAPDIKSPDAKITGGRIQVLLASRPAAGYFTLENQGDSALMLNGASAPDCKSMMLHESKNESGVEHMDMVAMVPVPPHGTVKFAPGGYHLMCMQPSGPLLTHKGTEPVTLHFAGGATMEVPFNIQGVHR